MTKYKLVPIEPTKEMIDEGRTARTHPMERYKAMLAAAPVVDQKPSTKCSGAGCTDQGCPAHYANDSQPAPEVAELVEALEEMIDIAVRVDGWESFPSDPIERAEDAIRAYRKQGGEYD